MGACGFCNSTILFGGVSAGGRKFCDAKCARQAQLLAASEAIPAYEVDKLTDSIHAGACPKCQGPGPVDVHKSHQVWSALVMTRWSNAQQLSCRSCAIKRQAGAAAFSLVLGWWGFPWGLIFTPVQVVRNLVGIFAGPNPAHPSEDLRKLARLTAGAQVMSSAQRVVEARPVQRASGT